MSDYVIEEFSEKDLPQMIEIWNSIVEAGEAFPQEENLSLDSAREFFRQQSFCAIARENSSDSVLGLYILHPNNIGRCGHICNASYTVAPQARNRGIGRALVENSLTQAARLGFRIMQFNAVVADNANARQLYTDLGFHPLGTIAGGFRNKSGKFKDICLYWREL